MSRQVNYNNKDFGQFRQSLIEHAKNYYPNTYRDFNEASPGMMFIEMASMVGDVLSFYNDKQLQESLINLASEKKNIYNLAQNYGYKPNTLVPAQVDIQVMQLVPSKFEDGEWVPNMDYALHMKEGMISSTKDGVKFRTIEPVNFQSSEKQNPVKTSIHEILNDGTITYFQLTKMARAVSGRVHTEDYIFESPKEYDKIVIDDDKVAEIVSITDADDDTWHQVGFLSQDLIPMSIRNIPYNDPELAVFNSTVPYILCFKQTEKRFITRLRADDKFEIQFGSGKNLESDEEILPNPFNVGLGIDYFKRANEVAIDPMNFLNTKTYGQAPGNTTLTVTYTTSNGLADNVKSDSIEIIDNVEYYDNLPNIDPVILDLLKNDNSRGVKITNPSPAYGGLNQKPLNIIKEEAIANFAAQNRSVTKEDYILRCYTMPGVFGSVAKAYIEKDEQVSNWNDFEKIPNPYALNLYILAYNEDNSFTIANPAIKQNLRRYLQQYRLMTDAINIKDAFIVNVGVDFEIITRPNYNSHEVIARCINRLKEIMHQTNMEINSPIILSNIYTELDKLEGVQTVIDIKFTNLFDETKGYSGNCYDVVTATRNGIIYPSLDPCVFEIKFPDRDIKGRVIDL